VSCCQSKIGTLLETKDFWPHVRSEYLAAK